MGQSYRPPRFAQRDAPADVCTRVAYVTPNTIDEETRSVEAVIATEAPVYSTSVRDGRRYLEVLRMDGISELPDQLPLLDSHQRNTVGAQLGSIRGLRVDGDRLLGRPHLSDVEYGTWIKIREGHVRDISVGRELLESVPVRPGQTREVGGRSYTAPPNETLWIVTRWRPVEGSLTVIGADPGAKIRSSLETNAMNKALRSYLESIGLRSEATDAEAWQYFAGLKGDQAQAARALLAGDNDANRNDDVGDGNPDADGNRSDDAGDANRDADGNRSGDAGDGNRAAPTPEQIAADAIRSERRRVTQLRDLARDDVPEDLLQRAIDEGWTADRAAPRFLDAVRDRRRHDGVPDGAPAGHAHSRSGSLSVRSLAAGLLIGRGVDPIATPHFLHDGRRDPGRRDQFAERDADIGDEFRNLPMVDVIRECARLDTGRWIRDPEEAWRTAVSGASLSNVFTTNVYARLMEGWETVGDTTMGWCDEEDVQNFMQQEEITLQANSRPKRLPRGGTAEHATASDSHETYRIARYAEQFVIDDQDRIDDRLSAMNRMPMELGEGARQLRPDMVYGLLLENPSLVADSAAVFNATAQTTAGGHANLGTTALSDAGLKAAITAMVSQRLKDPKARTKPGKQLGLRPRYLIVPAALEWTARALTSAAALAKLFADSSDPIYPLTNLIREEGLRVVIDDRIGAIGVEDPRTNPATVRTGVDTNWFLAAGGRKSVRVAYRTGTNRRPQLRSFVLSQGQWGIGWDINLDIGAAFMDFRGWYKSTGAGA